MQNLRARGQSPRFSESTTLTARAEEEGTLPATDLPRRHIIRNRIGEIMMSHNREGWWQSLFNANTSIGQRVLFFLAVLFTSVLYFGKTIRSDIRAGDGDGFPGIDSSSRRNTHHSYHHRDGFYREASKTVLKPTDASKSHVLVTGGAGFIGSHGTLKLIEEG